MAGGRELVKLAQLELGREGAKAEERGQERGRLGERKLEASGEREI